MAEHDPVTLTIRFNDCINRQDIDGLAQLMTDDHTFIDSADAHLRGKDACLDAWRGFFRLFPDYQNVFEHVEARDDLALVLGYSTCSEAQLAGPAIWTVRVHLHRVAEWRVSDDTADLRRRLNLAINPR